MRSMLSRTRDCFGGNNVFQISCTIAKQGQKSLLCIPGY
jgi:hypothetical protein